MTSACFSRGHTGFSRNATLVATVNPPALEDVRHKICLYELSPKDVGQSQIEQLHKIDKCVVGFHILEKDRQFGSVLVEVFRGQVRPVLQADDCGRAACEEAQSLPEAEPAGGGLCRVAENQEVSDIPGAGDEERPDS